MTLAQELENQNIDGKTSLKFDKELKEILKKTTTIDSGKLEKLTIRGVHRNRNKLSH